MKKRIFAIFLMFLTISMVNVKAESISSGYSLLIRQGEVTESFSTSEVTTEVKNIFNNTVSFSNSFISINNLNANRLSITDASAALSGPLSMTITGDNTIDVLTLTSCSVSISGTGTLKFVPSFFGEEGIITSVEEQQQFVSSRIKTNLSITYEDGYVYINKKVIDTSNKETVENNTTDVIVEEDNSKNQNSNDTIKNDESNVNTNTNSNTNTTTNNTNDNSSNNNDNIIADSDTENSENASNEVVSENEVVDTDEAQTNEITPNNETSNMPLYVGIGVGSIAVVGVGTLIFKRVKH